MERTSRLLIFSLFLMAFSTSTFLSISGVIPEIGLYYHVPFMYACLFVGLFAFILAFSGLFLPQYLSRFERKRFFLISLTVFIFSSFAQIFITDFYLALLVRVIPAFFYSSVIGIALTITSEISAKSTNRVILGVSSGTIVGVSISTYIALKYGYPAVNVWLFLINMLALCFILQYFPKMPGKPKQREFDIDAIYTKKFLVSVIFIVILGISVSSIYNYFAVILATLSNINEELTISLFLFFNGIASMIGTTAFGYFLIKNSKLAILAYPLSFALVIFSMGMLIEMPILTFVTLMAFGFLDGSMHTVCQYWITSALKDSPEFANGCYLFLNNTNRTIGILTGAYVISYGNIHFLFTLPIVLLLLSTFFVKYRIDKYPESCENVHD